MIRLTFRMLIKLLLLIVILVVIYLAAAFILPYMRVNRSFKNAENGIKIFVITNGVHTDIVLPANTVYKNWQTDFAPATFNVTKPAYNYIGFGWGDKGFYLETPTWADLIFSTAFKAVFALSETAMHITYLKEPNLADSDCVELHITEAQYQTLITYIESSFEKNENGIMLINHEGYGAHDRFYEALGKYSLFKTCNTWTHKGLKKAGVKVAAWSPFSKGLMRSLKD